MIKIGRVWSFDNKSLFFYSFPIATLSVILSQGWRNRVILLKLCICLLDGFVFHCLWSRFFICLHFWFFTLSFFCVWKSIFTCFSFLNLVVHDHILPVCLDSVILVSERIGFSILGTRMYVDSSLLRSQVRIN